MRITSKRFIAVQVFYFLFFVFTGHSQLSVIQEGQNCLLVDQDECVLDTLIRHSATKNIPELIDFFVLVEDNVSLLIFDYITVNEEWSKSIYLFVKEKKLKAGIIIGEGCLH